jgi:hypothetical protein
MALNPLSDRELAEIDRDADSLIMPSPDQIRRMVSEIRARRADDAKYDELNSSHLRAISTLSRIRTMTDTTLQMEAAR